MINFALVLLVAAAFQGVMAAAVLGLARRPRLTWPTFIGFVAFGLLGAFLFAATGSVLSAILAYKFQNGVFPMARALMVIRFGTPIVAVVSGWLGAIRVDRKRREWLVIFYRWRCL